MPTSSAGALGTVGSLLMRQQIHGLITDVLLGSRRESCTLHWLAEFDEFLALFFSYTPLIYLCAHIYVLKMFDKFVGHTFFASRTKLCTHLCLMDGSRQELVSACMSYILRVWAFNAHQKRHCLIQIYGDLLLQLFSPRVLNFLF